MRAHGRLGIDCLYGLARAQELKGLNIGSRPAKRGSKGGIETLRAIPWMFAWTQVRLHLPVWMGVGSALKAEVSAGNLALLQEMYAKWPFFQSTMELIEAVMAKVDVDIVRLYQKELVTPDLVPIGMCTCLSYPDLRRRVHACLVLVYDA